jgi:hypothetical protein
MATMDRLAGTTVRHPVAELDTEIQTVVTALGQARRRGLDFLLGHANDDGSVGPADESVFYYRIPWILALGGETAAGTRLIDWIRRHALRSDGRLVGPHPAGLDRYATAHGYPETCLAYGAHLLRQYDVAERVMAYAERYQDPVTGGASMTESLPGPETHQMLFLTCQLGMTALLMGRREQALAAGRFVERMWREQPELPDRLYTVATRAGLVTSPPLGADPCHYVNETAEERQYHYNGGIAAALLAQLWLATGDDRWLELARGYQRFSMGTTEAQFETAQVCKSGWGAALLASITSDPELVAWAVRMARWFVDRQQPDGHWDNTPYLDPEPGVASRLEITAEFTGHVDVLLASLSALT